MKWVSVTILFGFLASCAASPVSHDALNLAWQPKPQEPGSKLIWFNRTNYETWSNILDNYLEAYRTPSLTKDRIDNLVKCNYTNPPENGKVCHVNVDSYTPCIATNYFGYKKLSPCVFLEVEKALNWTPKFYTSMSELPKEMPDSLKSYIDEITVDPSAWETIWVSCDGETSADQEFIGPVHYIPQPGFPGYFYPFDGRVGYLSPVMAIHFQQPKIGVIINVECKLWSPNIRHQKEPIGVAKFQLLID